MINIEVKICNCNGWHVIKKRNYSFSKESTDFELYFFYPKQIND
jgi:hypothetical protein